MENYFEFENFNDDLLIQTEYSNFATDPVTAGIETLGKGLEMGGKIAEASARKKEADAKIKEIGGKRQAQLKDCEESKEFKKLLDRKYRNNRISDCKKEVNKRLNAEENEQKEIVRRMTAIEEGKLSADLEKSKSTFEEKKSSKKLYVIGGIVALTLVLATFIVIKNRK